VLPAAELICWPVLVVAWLVLPWTGTLLCKARTLAHICWFLVWPLLPALFPVRPRVAALPPCWVFSRLATAPRPPRKPPRPPVLFVVAWVCELVVLVLLWFDVQSVPPVLLAGCCELVPVVLPTVEAADTLELFTDPRPQPTPLDWTVPVVLFVVPLVVPLVVVPLPFWVLLDC
jgi:hypothetical protein